MQFWWPFPIKQLRQAANAAPLAEARAELAAAEAALEAARTTYRRLQESHQPAKLRVQQIALDRTLERYLIARQTVRALERPEPRGPARARSAGSATGLSLTRG